MRIAILGAGNMGTALAVPALENKSSVIFWSIESSVVEEINEKKLNSKYLKGVVLKGDVSATLDLKTALERADIIVFALPSQVIRKVAKQCSELMPNKAIVVSAAKGLEQGSNKRVSEVLNEYFNNPFVVIGGPSIANELGKKQDTFVVFASKNNKSLIRVKEAFETSYYNISSSNDVAGVELCGALKNIIAILAGISDGLGKSSNSKAGLVSKGLDELRLIITKFGGEAETVYGLAGLGDLVVTCTSVHSRNRRFGELIGKKVSKEEAVKKVGQVVEGLTALNVVMPIINKYKLNTPLIKKTYNLVILGKE
ncbi:MAG: NAD(P)H-dependent glycerol-3-phosphate dehydrogenase [Nanoarchaeota archaeon]|nr:NAD(P)H-dependent glycerol-3-phosphate dehydrogenase [Nanoarchaeota archaeon]